MFNPFKVRKKAQDSIDSLGELPRPSVSVENSHDLYYPLAEVVEPEMKTRGFYKHGYPQGAVVHYTAGRWGNGAVSYGRKKGFCYFLIDENGLVHQAFPLNRWGYHAGESKWGKTTSLSQRLVGIEIACPGKLEHKKGKWRTWWGEAVADKRVRAIAKDEDNMKAGHYYAFTQDQERSLTALSLWLKRNNPSIFSLDLVLGHDEIAPTRKTDPGGSLSISMPAYREYLKDLYGE